MWQAFIAHKRAVCSESVFRNLNFKREFIFQTNASARGIGVVLSQHDENSIKYPIAYYSPKLLPRETCYSTIEKRSALLLRLLPMPSRYVYLLGRKFVIQTDHWALEWMNWLKDNNAQLMWWSPALQPYQFKIQNWARTANNNANRLSQSLVEIPQFCCQKKCERVCNCVNNNAWLVANYKITSFCRLKLYTWKEKLLLQMPYCTICKATVLYFPSLA